MTRAIFKYRAHSYRFGASKHTKRPSIDRTNAIIISTDIALLLPRNTKIFRFVDRPTLRHVQGGRWREKARQPRMQMGRLSPSKPPRQLSDRRWLKTQISGARQWPPLFVGGVIDGRADACHPWIYGIYYNADGSPMVRLSAMIVGFASVAGIIGGLVQFDVLCEVLNSFGCWGVVCLCDCVGVIFFF